MAAVTIGVSRAQGELGALSTLLCKNDRRRHGQRTCLRNKTNVVSKTFTRARRASERQMPRAVSRKDFLRLGGVGLAGVALLGAADCGGRLDGNKDVVKFLTGTEETTTQERAVTEIQVN